jgi:hypothetical protein
MMYAVAPLLLAVTCLQWGDGDTISASLEEPFLRVTDDPEVQLELEGGGGGLWGGVGGSKGEGRQSVSLSRARRFVARLRVRNPDMVLTTGTVVLEATPFAAGGNGQIFRYELLSFFFGVYDLVRYAPADSGGG